MSKFFSRIFQYWFCEFELRILFVIFALIFAIFGALLLLGELRPGATVEFDRRLLLLLREPHDLADPVGGAWLEELGRDFTALGGFPILTLFTLAVVGFLAFAKHKVLAVIILVSTLLALLLSSGLKAAIDRARPDLVPHKTLVHTASFPSGHAMHSAATYLTLGGLLARYQGRRRLKTFILAMALFTAFLVGVSRVYLGVHWPTDVLGGWLLGLACALLTLMLARGLVPIVEQVVADDAV